MTTLKIREEQISSITEEQRDEYDTENNPILSAESAPNRFCTMSMFFPEEDGVRIEEDLAFHTIEVFYFDTEGNETKVEEGTVLYNWASNHYEENWGNY
jgi:hypothetical protein